MTVIHMKNITLYHIKKNYLHNIRVCHYFKIVFININLRLSYGINDLVIYLWLCTLHVCNYVVYYINLMIIIIITIMIHFLFVLFLNFQKNIFFINHTELIYIRRKNMRILFNVFLIIIFSILVLMK